MDITTLNIILVVLGTINLIGGIVLKKPTHIAVGLFSYFAALL